MPARKGKAHMDSFEIQIDFSSVLNRELMVELGERIFIPGYKARMRRGVGVDDSGNPSPHAPLRPSRKGRKSGSVPLVSTGSMVNSFGVDYSRTTDETLVMGFPPDQQAKAAAHQYGNPARNLSARPHVGMTQAELDAAVRLIEKRIAGNIDKILKIR